MKKEADSKILLLEFPQEALHHMDGSPDNMNDITENTCSIGKRL